jgi:hypothetical protein
VSTIGDDIKASGWLSSMKAMMTMMGTYKNSYAPNLDAEAPIQEEPNSIDAEISRVQQIADVVRQSTLGDFIFVTFL